MNYKIFNEDHLTDAEIDGSVVRVKAFMINSKNEILVASSNGGVQLIGGHVEKEEKQINTLKREIMEETGIDISYEEISDAFYEVRHYIKDYFQTSKNMLAKVLYYIVKTDKVPNLEHVKLTKQEQKYDFHIQYISFDNFQEYVKQYLNSEKEINRLIASEMLSAFEELKKVI